MRVLVVLARRALSAAVPSAAPDSPVPTALVSCLHQRFQGWLMTPMVGVPPAQQSVVQLAKEARGRLWMPERSNSETVDSRLLAW